MQQSTRLLVLVFLAVWLSGCVVAIGNDGPESRDSRWAEIERDNRRAIDSLLMGMGIREVQLAMPHEADFSEAFMVDGVAHRVLFYRTQRVEGDGVPLQAARPGRDHDMPSIVMLMIKQVQRRLHPGREGRADDPRRIRTD